MKLEKEVSKFIRFAEVLPNNPTSQKILKEREEIKAAEDERIRIENEKQNEAERAKRRKKEAQQLERDMRMKQALAN